MQACDAGEPPKCATGTLLINVDSNLNAPQITDPGFNDNYRRVYVITETQGTDVLIDTLSALDADQGVRKV